MVNNNNILPAKQRRQERPQRIKSQHALTQGRLRARPFRSPGQITQPQQSKVKRFSKYMPIRSKVRQIWPIHKLIQLMGESAIVLNASETNQCLRHARNALQTTSGTYQVATVTLREVLAQPRPQSLAEAASNRDRLACSVQQLNQVFRSSSHRGNFGCWHNTWACAQRNQTDQAIKCVRKTVTNEL